MDLTSSTGELASHWSTQHFTLSRVEEALALLQEPLLLLSFFERLLEVLTLIEANESTMGFDTSLAWDMIERAQANILVYGESGAGKSLLVRTLTGDEDARSSATTVGTTEEHGHRTPSGINFIDTPGIKIPLVAEADSSFRYLRDRLNWNSMLADLHRRLRSSSAATRPLGVVYVHRATMRVIPERIADLVGKSHRLLVPTFILLSDVTSVDDEALKEVRDRLRAIATELGPNARNHKVHVIEVNTATKVVSGHRHPSRGLPEFVSTLLTHLDPIDALTFTRRNYLASTVLAVSEAKKRQVRAALLARRSGSNGGTGPACAPTGAGVRRPRDGNGGASATGEDEDDEDGGERGTPGSRASLRQRRA